MKHTAVDFAFEKLANQGLLVTKDYKNLVVYREAKEMEKEQTCGFVRDYIDDKCYASFKGCMQCSGSVEGYDEISDEE
jgi:hypothetical protein